PSWQLAGRQARCQGHCASSGALVQPPWIRRKNAEGGNKKESRAMHRTRCRRKRKEEDQEKSADRRGRAECARLRARERMPGTETGFRSRRANKKDRRCLPFLRQSITWLQERLPV